MVQPSIKNGKAEINNMWNMKDIKKNIRLAKTWERELSENHKEQKTNWTVYFNFSSRLNGKWNRQQLTKFLYHILITLYPLQNATGVWILSNWIDKHSYRYV